MYKKKKALFTKPLIRTIEMVLPSLKQFSRRDVWAKRGLACLKSGDVEIRNDLRKCSDACLEGLYDSLRHIHFVIWKIFRIYVNLKLVELVQNNEKVTVIYLKKYYFLLIKSVINFQRKPLIKFR